MGSFAKPATTCLLLLALGGGCRGNDRNKTSPDVFSFHYALHEGLGQVALEIHVSGRSARMIRRQSTAVGTAAAVGVFRAELDEHRRDRLMDILRRARNPTGGAAPDAAHIGISARVDGRDVAFDVPRTPVAMGKYKTLMGEIASLETVLGSSPAYTLHLVLANRKQMTCDHVVVVLGNTGTRATRIDTDRSTIMIETASAAPAITNPDVTPLPTIWTMLAEVDIKGMGTSTGSLQFVEVAAAGTLSIDSGPLPMDRLQQLVRARFDGFIVPTDDAGEVAIRVETISNHLTFRAPDE